MQQSHIELDTIIILLFISLKVYSVEFLARELFQPNGRNPAADIDFLNLVDLSFDQKILGLLGVTLKTSIKGYRSHFGATLTVQNICLVFYTLAARPLLGIVQNDAIQDLTTSWTRKNPCSVHILHSSYNVI